MFYNETCQIQLGNIIKKWKVNNLTDLMDDKPQILETKIRIYFKFLALYFQRKGCVWGRPKTYPDPKDMGL